MFDGLKAATKRLKRELKIYRCVLKDKRSPRLGKFFLGAAIGYLMLPFDLIPDFIPVLGYLDDVIIVPMLFLIGIRFIPKEIIEECRKAVHKEL